MSKDRELVAAYDYELPAEAIAQRPLAERDAARLLVVDRASGRIEERVFREIGALLRAGDALVVNDTRVIPARLRARARGAPIEILLLREVAPLRWRALARPARRAPLGEVVELEGGPSASVAEVGERGERVLDFTGRTAAAELAAYVESSGETPLPPYIRRASDAADRADYQTVYAREPGAVAAPTAGLHFTQRLLDELAAAGVRVVRVTLDVGLPTFRPLTAERLDEVMLGSEAFYLSADTALTLQKARDEGGRIVAVGTTVVRALESAWDEARGRLQPGRAETTLFIRPGHPFRAVDALVTNFHLPRTSLLVLVSAFAGLEMTLASYRRALALGFRFASYGDAMMIL